MYPTPDVMHLGAAAVSAGVLATALTASYAHVSIDGFLLDGGWLQFAFGILLHYVLNYGGAKDRLVAAMGFGLIGAASHRHELLAIEKSSHQKFPVAGAFALAALYLRPLDRRLLTAPALRPILAVPARDFPHSHPRPTR